MGISTSGLLWIIVVFGGGLAALHGLAISTGFPFFNVLLGALIYGLMVERR